MHILHVRFSSSSKVYQYIARNPLHIDRKNWFKDWKAIFRNEQGEDSEVEIVCIETIKEMDEIISKYVDIDPSQRVLQVHEIPKNFIRALKQNGNIIKYKLEKEENI